MHRLLLAIVTATGVSAGVTPWASQVSTYDILVTNGRVLDGSGNPWLRQDLAVTGDRIVQGRPVHRSKGREGVAA